MTKKKTRAKRFADLTWGDLEEWAGGKIVSRGKSYQQQDMEALKNWRDEFLTR